MGRGPARAKVPTSSSSEASSRTPPSEASSAVIVVSKADDIAGSSTAPSLILKFKMPSSELRKLQYRGLAGAADSNDASNVPTPIRNSSPVVSATATGSAAGSPPAIEAAPALLPTPGKPGPKRGRQPGQTPNKPGRKKQKLENGMPAPPGPTKLGPKANQGAINAQLRALDRTGKPCKRWQKTGFTLKSFTGFEWQCPSWGTPSTKNSQNSSPQLSANTSVTPNTPAGTSTPSLNPITSLGGGVLDITTMTPS